MLGNKVFEFALNVFLSPSSTAPKRGKLNKLARMGTNVSSTLDDLDSIDSRRNSIIDSRRESPRHERDGRPSN